MDAVRQAHPFRVLLVEPDPETAVALRRRLEDALGERLDLGHAPRLNTALGLVGQPGYDAVLLDLDGSEDTCPVERVRERSPIPIVALTGSRDPETALEALRRGAHDCLRKDETDAPLLVRSVLHAVESFRLSRELDSVRKRERFMATHDQLTGLPNRFAFEEHLRRVIAYASRSQSPLAVLFLGLDRFRTVNDTVGHAHGDELMVQVARRLKSNLRKSDLVARVGGDEFVAVLGEIPHPQAAGKVASKLRDALEPPHVVGGREYWVGASAGIAIFPRDGGDPDSLIRNAYTAMREAKASGGDGHRFFSSAMNAGSDKRQALETRLRRALEHDELELHYQPKVEIETGRITGAEGLLRWTDTELGAVEPADVIPLAEETGLIAEIGSWSLRTACADCAAWQALGFGGLRVSVNLSPRQVVDDSIREQVVRALWDTGLAPSQLELEITEGTLMENEEVAVRLLEDLKEVGVVISLDDFGTGFSSLSYLKRFPVDVLKIDQSFVQDIAVDPDDAAIVGAIISIADNLQLGVIAEGVENEQQRAFLRGRGCPEMQGFLFAPAVPSAQLVEMLRKQRERQIE